MVTDLTTQRRNEIIAASARVFAEKGYHSTNISDIAAELNIGHGTFYRYFQNKLDIFVNVISGVIGSISQVVITEQAGEADTLDEYREQLFRIGDGLVGIMLDNPIAVRILFYESLGIDEEVNMMIHKAFDLFGAYTQSYLENGMSKGFLRPDIHTREAALAVNSMLLEAARRIVTAPDVEEAKTVWIDTIIALMLDGLKSG
jgi:AcrR family transcriptional regulator